MKKQLYFINLFLTGAAGYCLLEILWRGYTHWAMAPVGGLCLIIIGAVNTFSMKPALKALICSGAITAVEYISGTILNIVLKWNVWDYSDRFLNVSGQICPLYSVLWFFLSLAVITVMNRFRRKAFF